MNEQAYETGFFFSLSDGSLTAVKFKRHDGGRAWGIGPDGRASWLAGQFTIGKDLFMTEAEAKSAGDVARLKKLASLRKQIVKLEKMTFCSLAK